MKFFNLNFLSADVFNRRSYLSRLLLTVFIAFFIPCSIIELLLVRQSSEQMVSADRAFYAKSATLYSTYVDSYINDLVMYALQIGLDNQFSQNYIEKNPYHVLEASTVLERYLFAVNAQDIALYFEDTDYLITSKYKYTLSQYADKYFQDRTSDAHSTFIRFLSQIPDQLFRIYSSFPNEPGHVWLSVPITVTASTAKRACILFLLDNSTLSGPIFNFDNDTQASITYNGTLIYSSRMSENASDVYEQFQATSDFYGFSCMLSAPTSGIYAYSRKLTQTLYITMSVGCILMLFILAYATYSTYKPVKKLVNKLGSAKEKRQSEFVYIEDAFERLSSEHKSLSDVVTEQKLILEESTILKLLLFGVDSAETFPQLQEDDSVVVACIKGEPMSGIQRNLCVTKIQNLFNARMYILDIPNESYKCIVTTLPTAISPDDYTSALTEILTDMGMSVYVGKYIPSWENLQDSYNEARLKMRRNDLLSFSTGFPNDQNACSKLALTDDALCFVDFACKGDSDSAVEYLRLYFDHIEFDQCDSDIRAYIVHQLLAAILREVDNAGYNIDAPTVYRLIYLNDASSFTHEVVSLIHQIAAELDLKQSETDNRRKREIVRYVDEQCFDINICLLNVADHFDLSIYTLSRMFKEITGIGFKEYVSKRRIEQAQYLLRTTDMSIKEISEKIGFSNSDYLTRIFKANLGVTPSVYREEVLKQNE